MSLEMFDRNAADAVNYAARVSAPELPSTFEDNIADAWSRGRMVESSVSGSLRKSRALSDYMDEVTAKSGTSLQMGETVDGFPSIGEMAVKVREIKAANPNVDIADLSDEEIQRRADEIGVRQLSDSAALDRRERTAGGSVGSFLGTAGAAVIDPVNLIAFPLAAPTSLGILGTALAWSVIGAGSQAAIEVINAGNMERIQPGYGASGEPLENILGAGLAGGVLGGGLKGLSNVWTRAKTGSWPRTVRDAGNVIDSEVQIAATNPLPGIEGEAAHRTALNKAIDDIANGRPVDVDGIVQAEQFAARDAAIDPVIAARDAAVAAQQAAKEAAAAPSGPLVVARRMPDGTIREGKPGQIHADLVEPNASPLSVSDDQMGFALSDGTFLTRDEATAMLDRTYPDLSKRIDGRRDGAVRQIEAGQYNDAVRQAQPPQPDLPFVQTEAAVLAEVRAASLVKGIQNIASKAGHELSDQDAAKIAARISQMNDPDKARALLDEVFVRPQTIADTLPAVEKPVKPATDRLSPDAVASLRDELTPAKIEEMRLDPDMEDTISRDLDKLMLERPDMEVPTGVTQDADGRMVPTTRKVESVIAEADTRLAAAKEIEACVGPYPAAEAA